MAAELTDTELNKRPLPVKLAGINDVLGRAREIHELIARRAYAIYEGRGHVGGNDKEDWRQAESDVLTTLFVGFMELNGDLSVDIGIAACELPQLQVAIEPWRLIVSGKRRVPGGEVAQSYPDGKPRPMEIFQVVDFPIQVEASRAKATLSNGLLEFRIPKARKTVKSLAAKAA
ncbi:MAG: DUF2934 domain-containing protein [Terriglobia bacterium]